jgi:hypothetical protein
MTTPYIGCQLSLISKNGIRYEGTLAAIDPDAATVSLQGGMFISFIIPSYHDPS